MSATPNTGTPNTFPPNAPEFTPPYAELLPHTDGVVETWRGQFAKSTVGFRNRYGPAVRRYAIPVQPNSAPQLAQRDAFKTASLAWQTITDRQRRAWNTAARRVRRRDDTGRAYTFTGQLFFMSINTPRALAGEALLSAPPLTN